MKFPDFNAVLKEQKFEVTNKMREVGGTLFLKRISEKDIQEKIKYQKDFVPGSYPRWPESPFSEIYDFLLLGLLKDRKMNANLKIALLCFALSFSFSTNHFRALLILEIFYSHTLFWVSTFYIPQSHRLFYYLLPMYLKIHFMNLILWLEGT